MEELGKALRQWRKSEKMTQQTLATAMGVRRQYVQQIETGTDPMPVWMLAYLPDEFRPMWFAAAIAKDQQRRESA